MPGRKKPEMTENEREHEYVMMQKRSHGDEVVAEEAADLADKGAAAEVARERGVWAGERARRGRKPQ